MSQAIEQTLQQPEGKTLEFKRDLSSPHNVLKQQYRLTEQGQQALARQPHASQRTTTRSQDLG